MLTDNGSTDAEGSDARYPSLRIVREPLKSDHRGISSRRGAGHHWRVARLLRAHADPRQTVVHCGRSLHEGAGALLARTLGGPRYVCWTHGEDIATALTSRELTWLTKLVYRRSAGAFAEQREHGPGTRESGRSRRAHSRGVSRRRCPALSPGGRRSADSCGARRRGFVHHPVGGSLYRLERDTISRSGQWRRCERSCRRCVISSSAAATKPPGCAR